MQPFTFFVVTSAKVRPISYSMWPEMRSDFWLVLTPVNSYPNSDWSTARANRFSDWMSVACHCHKSLPTRHISSYGDYDEVWFVIQHWTSASISLFRTIFDPFLLYEYMLSEYFCLKYWTTFKIGKQITIEQEMWPERSELLVWCPVWLTNAKQYN